MGSHSRVVFLFNTGHSTLQNFFKWLGIIDPFNQANPASYKHDNGNIVNNATLTHLNGSIHNELGALTPMNKKHFLPRSHGNDLVSSKPQPPLTTCWIVCHDVIHKSKQLLWKTGRYSDFKYETNFNSKCMAFKELRKGFLPLTMRVQWRKITTLLSLSEEHCFVIWIILLSYNF